MITMLKLEILDRDEKLKNPKEVLEGV